MSLLRESMEAAEADDLLDDELESEPIQQQGPGFRAADLLPDISFILAPTGEGSIDDYIDHPMNPNESRGVARILRGATGMLGQLNYAIIDIALGTIEVMKEGKKPHAEASNGE